MWKKLWQLVRALRTRIRVEPITLIKTPSTLLRGKRALVTGGSSGIGFAIAQAMAKAGAEVWLVGRNRDRLDACAKQIGGHALLLDICDIKAVEHHITTLYASSPIDILVNAAGVHGNDAFGQVNESVWNQVIDTNLKALYFMCQAVSREMVKRSMHGHILNISSASSLKPGWTPYEISKRGVDSITQGFAHQLIAKGIVVNGLAPGPTATAMLACADGKNLYWEGNPSGRMSTVEEIAQLALFMVSDCGNGIVGDTFFLTGGSGTVCIDR